MTTVIVLLSALLCAVFGKYYKTSGNLSLWDMIPDDEPLVYKGCSKIEKRRNNTGELGICYGEDTTWASYPYMVALRYPSGSSCCTGAIIELSPFGKILTAAHCSVCSGPAIIGCNDPANCDGVAFTVASRLNHPLYTGNIANGYDVAVLTLATEINIPGATAISIPSFEETEVSVRLTGYGPTESGFIPTQLQTGLTTSIGQGVCNEQMLGIVTITDTMYCVTAGALEGGNGVTACGTDAGGPIVYDNQIYGVNSFTIVGSGSPQCDGYCYCCSGFPQVGSNVAVLSPWILTQIN